MSGGETITHWLSENNLQQVIPQFYAENMTMEELLALGADSGALKEYLSALDIPKPASIRITSKIKKQLIDSKEDSGCCPKSGSCKVTRIIISEEEEKAMSNLSEYNVHLCSLMEKLATNSDKVTENEKKMKSEIESGFGDALKTITNHKDNLSEKIREISKMKQAAIIEKAESLAAAQEMAEKAMIDCDELLIHGNVDKFEKKKRILMMIQNATNPGISQKSLNIETEANLRVNRYAVEQVTILCFFFLSLQPINGVLYS